MDVGDVTGNAAGGINIPESGIFPTRHNHRQIFLGRSHHPAVSRIDLVEFFKPALPQNLKQEFMRKFSLFVLGGENPFVDHDPFDPADGFLLGNAGVGHAIEMTLQERLFLLWAELAVVGQPLVFGSRN